MTDMIPPTAPTTIVISNGDEAYDYPVIAYWFPSSDDCEGEPYVLVAGLQVIPISAVLESARSQWGGEWKALYVSTRSGWNTEEMSDCWPGNDS